jgi:type I restriction enzyme S subunit
MISEWGSVRLREICRPKQWPTLPMSSLNSGPYPVFGANGQIGFYDKFTHPSTTIAVTCRGATCGTVNVCPPKTYITGNAMALDDLDTNRVWLRYLYHFLARTGFARVITGSAQPQITAQGISEVQVLLPPLEEQKRIAAILDKADAIRRKREQAIQLADEFLRALFLDMFGDPAHNPKHWPRKAFVEVLAIPLRNGISPSSDGTNAARVLTLSAITGRLFNPRAAKTALFVEPTRPEKFVDARDFLICRGNGNLHLVGKGKFPTPLVETAFPDTMIAARVGMACDRHYLEILWDTPCLRDQIEQGARTTNGTFKVNQQMLEGLQLPMPPLKLQQEFGEARNRIQETVERMQGQEEEHRALSSALAAKAFAGDL